MMPKSIRSLIFPQARCLACDEPRQIDPGSDLCARCAEALDSLTLSEHICPHCLSPLPSGPPCAYCAQGGMLGLSKAYAPFRYHGVSQRLIGRLKFQGIRRAARPLAEGMLDCLTGRSFDLLVPVPLHPDDLKKRGFNQSELLCLRLCQQTRIPLDGALIKVIRTHQQSSLSHEQREENVKNAYLAVRPLYGLHILLVDDVRTTGSTARACAKELLLAGAASVSLLTAAVAGRYKEGSVSS